MDNIKVDKLSDMGPTYQSKVISGLLSDKDFLETSYDILYPEYFESEAHQWIVTKTKEYFEAYKNIPTADVFKVELNKEKNSILKDEIIKKLIDASNYIDSDDIKFVKEQFIQFCINQHYKLSIYKSVDLLKNKEYDKIKKLFDEASRVGQGRDIGLDLLSTGIDGVFKMIDRNTISTPWEIINDITNGGSAPGELFIVVAGPGGGKTWALCAVGMQAVKLGKNVVHYSLELSESMVASRYYSILTGIPSGDLQYHKDDIEKRLKSLSNKSGNLIIKSYPTKRATISTLSAHIDILTKKGKRPDLVIVDYGDLLKSPQYYKDKRLEIGNIFEELRGMSGEFKIPIWTASQANRSAAETDIISGEQISEDYSKIMIGDFVVSISRKIEDSLHKTARIFIIKNRFGVDKITFPAKFDVSNGNLSIYEEKSVQGKDLSQKMENKDNIIKKMIKNRLYSDSISENDNEHE